MTTYTIEYDLSELKKLVDNFAENVGKRPSEFLPNTSAAFAEAAARVQTMWQDKIAKMPGTTGKMINSILARQKGELHHVVYSDNRKVEELNNGSKAVTYDMKQTHPYGKKSRVSEKGVPYLIVKFRWRTPGQSDELAHKDAFSSIIPTAMYNTRVKGMQLTKTNPLKTYFEKNFRGENIERNGYDWGDRLTEDQAWNDRSVGMVRALDDRPNKSGKVFGEYFTFRIISARSPANSWWYRKKAKPATNYMAELEQEIKPVVDRVINEGIAKDTKA